MRVLKLTRLLGSSNAKGIVRNYQIKSEYDAIVIGAGHNGLVAAAYLQKSGLKVCVLERRHVIGGAAVTEEIIPGFKFSRASYVLSLLRPQIIEDLELKKYGLKIYLRNPSSYTPLIEPGGVNGKAKSLTISRDHVETARQIAQFSVKDAKAFSVYEEQLGRIVSAIDTLLDHPPLSLPSLISSSFKDKWNSLNSVKVLLNSMKSLGKDFPAFYEFMTAPAMKILNNWFESEPLKATLATDSVIGAMISPFQAGSGYVLLHHVMGELEGIKGAWGYVEGGMGSVSKAIANCATDHGADVFCNKPVSSILTNNGVAQGVVLEDGTEIRSKAVLSNATAKITFLNLLPQGSLPESLYKEISSVDYTSPVTKINVAVSEIPNFIADPNLSKNQVMPHHRSTIHINCEDSKLIHEAYLHAQLGKVSEKPMMEMVIPSSLDPTLCPAGQHVVLLFTQFTPYHLSDGEWTDDKRQLYANKVFSSIENYAPGFTKSIIGYEVLAPPDLEKIFGLTGGNIFHGALSLDQLYMSRPVTSLSNYRSHMTGLYLCGSSSHPGGGVMGSAGRLAASTVLNDYKSLA
ncbi:pyridine nucleotide-disulfide oxidoreductase domain-containing protein 2-like [Biomphalaria glabrata]|uniref:Pyridine nucleotide-disulfide oxidoreductase domain-containing protein 2 n=1 Tax=Biomphalaria glabrata TaxID=6526 RepID=A0A9W3B444_BIOGL|nr:pyridine nucleotide-disulfide oxidoreductase domain-containing protein 2-like [Biomphalaria glabrata]